LKNFEIWEMARSKGHFAYKMLKTTCFIMPFPRFGGLKILFCPLNSFFAQKLVC
jgi:hypothetical protein